MGLKLTMEQEAEARLEGWRLVGGVPLSITVGGKKCFESQFLLLHFILQRSADSEWHASVYESLGWNQVDDEASTAQKWGLFKHNVWSKDLTVFKNDEAAQEFVRQRAQAGCPLAQKAIKTVAKRRFAAGV